MLDANPTTVTAYDWRGIRLYNYIQRVVAAVPNQFDPVCWREIFQKVPPRVHDLVDSLATLMRPSAHSDKTSPSFAPKKDYSDQAVTAAFVALANNTDVGAAQPASDGPAYVRYLLLTQPRWLRALLRVYDVTLHNAHPSTGESAENVSPRT